MFLLLLTACFGVSSSSDAPFRLGRLVGQVWVVDPDSTQEDQSAILLLSDADLPCAQAKDNVYRDLDRAIGGGQGLGFFLDQDAGWDAEEGSVNLSWTGLWTTGYAFSTESGERDMQAFYFSDGFVYIDYATYYGFGGAVWLQIDEAGTDGVSGEFQMSGWSGRFSAENCGMWVEPDPVDTWDWDSW